MIGGKRIGYLGEELATRYLSNRGYQIVTRNYRRREGEIDIIALDPQRELTFCEVKTRTGQGFGAPAEAVDFYKWRKVVRTICHFRQEHQDFARLGYRFDVLAILVDLSRREAEIEHIKNAFV